MFQTPETGYVYGFVLFLLLHLLTYIKVHFSSLLFENMFTDKNHKSEINGLANLLTHVTHDKSYKHNKNTLS